ncbi:MAG: hypothetical protein ACU84Q_08005 [Gammaproteobacteria bacterium]
MPTLKWRELSSREELMLHDGAFFCSVCVHRSYSMRGFDAPFRFPFHKAAGFLADVSRRK